MNFETWHIWVIIALIFGIIEIFTSSFIAIGCLFTAVAAGFHTTKKVMQ